jgi:hypothetical protein
MYSMYASIFLGKLFGFYLLFVGLVMFMQKAKLLPMFEKIVQKPAMYFYGGLINLVMGLLLVLSHNVWSFSWPLILTLLSYLILLKGLLFLFFPEKSMYFSAKMLTPHYWKLFSYIYILLGLFLLVVSFLA